MPDRSLLDTVGRGGVHSISRHPDMSGRGCRDEDPSSLGSSSSLEDS